MWKFLGTLALTGGLLFTGCAPTFTHTYKGESQFYQDKYSCMQDAYRVGNPVIPSHDPYYNLGQAVGLAIARQQMFNHCMKAGGWKIDKQTR